MNNWKLREYSKNAFLELITRDAEAAGSQLELAKRLNVSASYLSEVLSNRREPGPKILTAYNVTRTTKYTISEEEKH